MKLSFSCTNVCKVTALQRRHEIELSLGRFPNMIICFVVCLFALRSIYVHLPLFLVSLFCLSLPVSL